MSVPRLLGSVKTSGSAEIASSTRMRFSAATALRTRTMKDTQSNTSKEVGAAAIAETSATFQKLAHASTTEDSRLQKMRCSMRCLHM